MFIANKYTKIYNQLIDNAVSQNRIKQSGYERHHILPQSLNGLNSSENLVYLTCREHFICHWLLTKMTEGKDKANMIYALNGMKRSNANQNRYDTKITSRVYARLKDIFNKQHSEFMTGKTPWNKGISRTEEQKKAHSLIMKGRKRSPESIAKSVAKQTGQKRTQDTKDKISLALAGLIRGPMSANEKHKRSIALKGKTKPVGFGDVVAKRMKEEFTKNNPNNREDLKKICPHCGINTGPTNYKRWHGDKCKMKDKE